MDINYQLTTQEADALNIFINRLCYADARSLSNTENEARLVLFSLHEIQQAIWQGAENASRD